MIEGKHIMPGEKACQFCARTPAAEVVFASYAALWLSFTVNHERGTYCQLCALALYRKHVRIILLSGWLAPVILFIPFAIWRNSYVLQKVTRLGPPTPPTQATFVVGGDRRAEKAQGFGAPLDAGRPLRTRLSSYTPLFAIAAAIVAVFVAHYINSH